MRGITLYLLAKIFSLKTNAEAFHALFVYDYCAMLCIFYYYFNVSFHLE